MEDHKQSRPQPAANKEEKILDLTKDMELADQEKHKIFDLSEGMDQPEVLQQEEPPSPSPSDPLAKETAPAISDAPAPDSTPATETATPPQTETTLKSDEPTPAEESPPAPEPPPVTASTPIEETPEPQETDAAIDEDVQADEPELTPDETALSTASPMDPATDTDTEIETASIEDEVDAAFNEVQSDPEPTKSEEDNGEQLFDKLSGITQMVDDAVREINKDVAPQDAPSEAIDDTALTSDAAELEAAISGEEDGDDIIELTEIVDPTEVMAADEPGDTDDEIIDLIDIVDPAELEGHPLEEAGIATMETSEPTDQAVEMPDAVDEDIPSAPEPDDPPTLDEEELALSDLDEDFDPEVELAQAPDDVDDFDTSEIDNLFGDDGLLEKEETSNDTTSSLDHEDDHDEQVILLTDVLKEGSKEERPQAAEDREAIDREDLVGDTELASDTTPSVPSPPQTEEQEDLSNLTIEAAVEHLLKTKYADTIEQMVAAAVQKAVTREVENIKKGLSDKDEPEV